MATMLAEPGGLQGLCGKSGGTEPVFSLEDQAFQGDHFRMYDFKVKRCPRARPHDWTACPFAHPGEKAKRRDPRRYRYSGTACPDFRKTGVCRRGDACPYSHGVFECWLHPSRYRTQMCTDGPSCRRRVCFFAHYEHELRRAEEYPPLLNQHLHASLVADARALQQQQLAQALSGILGSSPVPSSLAGSGASANLEPLLSVQLLKTLQQQTPAAASLLGVGGSGGDSAPTTPTGVAGLSPTGPLHHDTSNVLLQLQLLQQQQQQQQQGAAAAALGMSLGGGPLSDVSQHSGSSPSGSPRIGAMHGDSMGSPVGVPADDATHLARLLQQQQAVQQQVAAAAAAAAAAGNIDPALLAALGNLGLSGHGGGGGMQEDASAMLNRRSLDNGALARMAGAGGDGSFLAAAAAAALAGSTSLSNLGGGSLPNQGYLSSAAAMQGGGLMRQAAVEDGERAMSLEHILAELPRSSSQVNLSHHHQ